MLGSHLELLEQTDTGAIYAFKPTKVIADGKDLAPHLQGKLRVVKEPEPYVSSIELYAAKSFRASALIKIERFRSLLEYVPIHAGGPLALQHSDTTVSGSAMMASFNSNSRVDYSDIVKLD